MVAVPRLSPYRVPPAVLPEASAPRASRARFRPFRGAWVASVAAHVAVLGAITFAPVPDSPVVAADPEPQESYPYDVFMHMERWSAWPPPPWIQACFERTELVSPSYPFMSEYDLPVTESYGYLRGATDGWARLDVSHYDPPPVDHAAREAAGAVSDCINRAAQAGWSGRGRVFLRLERRGDGGAIATTTPLDADTDHDALLCCLRQAQESLAATLRPGGAYRFVLTFSAAPDPPFVRIDKASASRHSGGAAALRALQSELVPAPG